MQLEHRCPYAPPARDRAGLSPIWRRRLLAGFGAGLLLISGALHGADTPRSVFDLGLEELMQVEVVSPSRQAEPLALAPATMIVLTQDDLRQRAYRDLSEIFDDLPGMDMSRSYGDTWYRNQWRGLRKTISVPYQLLLDGQPLNHLYFNQDEIIAALPVNAVERIEVLYGPAGVIYGANAFVGVINVITRHATAVDPGPTGGTSGASRVHASLTRGSFDRQIIDLYAQTQYGEHRFSVAARRDDGALDDDARSGQQSFADAYYADRRLWGAFAGSAYGGQYDSTHQHEALDLRWQWRDSEVSVQHLQLQSGYGNVYAGDLVQNNGRWREPELAVNVRQRHRHGNWQGSTLLRWRESGVGDDSYFVEGYNVTDGNGTIRRVVDFSWWQAENHSLALSHDSDWQLTDRWSLIAGLRLEHKDLQKAYRTQFGPSLAPGTLHTLDDYPFPSRHAADPIANNRIDTRQSAVYAQLRHRASDVWFSGDQHIASFGWRHDAHSEFSDADSFRGSYVINNGRWTAKLLYGESFNEPAARELYGGWRGSGNDPQLDPETGDTTELHLSYSTTHYSAWLSAWRLHTENDIITFSGGATNLGARDIHGVDLGLRSRVLSGSALRSELWLYVSHIDASEQRPDAHGQRYDMPVGDTAENKWYAGWTWSPRDTMSLTLRGRHVTERDTVASNPVARVPAYTVFDLSLRWQKLFGAHDSVTLSVLNLGDRQYSHPGLREAGAGNQNGYFDANGVWRGSGDFFSSLLPQPGRSINLTLYWDY